MIIFHMHYNSDLQEVLLVGDCHCLVSGKRFGQNEEEEKKMMAEIAERQACPLITLIAMMQSANWAGKSLLNITIMLTPIIRCKYVIEERYNLHSDCLHSLYSCTIIFPCLNIKKKSCITKHCIANTY